MFRVPVLDQLPSRSIHAVVIALGELVSFIRKETSTLISRTIHSRIIDSRIVDVMNLGECLLKEDDTIAILDT